MILIYTDKLTPRIKYITRLIFTTILQNKVAFTTKPLEFLKSDLPKLNYSFEKFGDEFYIKPHRLLYCKVIINPTIQTVRYNGQKYFFESSPDSDLPFDPFAASFYLVTRYEEYINTTHDSHNRFPAKESILSKYGLLEKPVVNIWARLLGNKLKERYPSFSLPDPEFKFLSTIDIDNAWAYSHKGFFRSFCSLFKSLFQGKFSEASERIKVLFNKQPDPYDTYEFIDTLFCKNKRNLIFFFLLGDYGNYDKNISWKNRSLQKLINKTASRYAVGIHPSYACGGKRGKQRVKEEKRRLIKITSKRITKSRHHYLRLQLPRTYRHLIKAGIKQDHTMGYPSDIGFRAGICTPYYFYDLKKEKSTKLKIYPFQIMDVTLCNYMQLTPEQAITKIDNLMSEIKSVGGLFSSIWHNETLTDKGQWEGWRDVFIKMNKKGFQLIDDNKTDS